MDIQHLETHSVAWFNNVFTDCNVPANIRTLSERICRSYNISGICDPMYIANIIALELGLGDGQGEFSNQSEAVLHLSLLMDGLDSNGDPERCGLSCDQWDDRIKQAREFLAKY